MSFEAVFLIVFFVVTIVGAPLFGAESRPAFLRPDRKPPRFL
jgi:hypothetical protein